MARLVTSSFELNDPSNTTTTAPDGKRSGVNITTDLVTVRTGAVSYKGNQTSGTGFNEWTFTAIALAADAFGRIYVYMPSNSLVAGGNSGIISMGVTSAVLAGVQIETDGTLTLWALIGGVFVQQGSASPAIALDSWNMVDLRLRIGTGSVDQVEGRLNGASFASTSGLNITDSQIADFTIGFRGSLNATSATSGIMYFDDAALNDSSGAAQNSWPGDSKIVLLRPTADSAVGTGWTLGNTTATGGNAWSRLDDVPPNSAADLTTTADADQIRNATSNANVNYDATMTTYTAAGMGVSDTVNVVVPIIATGAPVVTSAKAGTVGVVSNPAISNIALGAGGTAGAFWSGVATGTYPTGNKWSFGTTTYASSVTAGTAPVMRVTQVTASTRIAIVTEMGMYVDYTPAPLPDLGLGLTVT